MQEKVRVDLEKLIDQTSFLLEKQEEARRVCVEKFNEFISFINDNLKLAKENNDQDSSVKLQEILSIIQSQLETFEGEILSDISFLKAQSEVLQAIKSEKDAAKAEELLSMITEGETILDTAKFKEEVAEEAKRSQQGFIDILEDFKAVLQEGNVDDLLIHLQCLQKEIKKESDKGNDRPKVDLDFLDEEDKAFVFDEKEEKDSED